MDVILSNLEFDPDPRLLPGEAAQMKTYVTIFVGSAPNGGGEMFGATLCTLEWIAAQPESSSLMSGLGLLIVNFEDFNEQRVRWEIERFLARIHEETWADIAKRIKEWFPNWKFDGYVP